nr:hypothetical protein [Tanacetum cinerariifolium]
MKTEKDIENRTFAEYIEYEARMKNFCEDESIDTIDSIDNTQEPKVEHENVMKIPKLEKITSRWHVCKTVRVFYVDGCGKDCGMWPTCNPDLSFCNGYDDVYRKGEHGMLEEWMCFRDHERQSVEGNRMIFADFLKVRYRNKNISDTTRERRYYEWATQNSEFNDDGISHEATMYDNPCKYHHEYPRSYFPHKDKGMPKQWEPLGYTNNKKPMDYASASQNLTPNEITNKFHQEDPIWNTKTYFPNFSQPQPSKPRPMDYSYKEWLRIKLGHTNVSNSVRNPVLNEWVLDNFDIKINYGKTHDDPYLKRKEGVCLDDVWKNAKNSMVIHYTHGTIRDSRKKSDGRVLDDALPLGRANGFRFMGRIRKEMDEEGGSNSKEMEFKVTSTRNYVEEYEHWSKGRRIWTWKASKGRILKTSYGITTPQDYVETHLKQEWSSP